MKLTAVLDTQPRRIVRAIVHPSDVHTQGSYVRPETPRLWVGAWPHEVGAVRVLRFGKERK